MWSLPIFDIVKVTVCISTLYQLQPKSTYLLYCAHSNTGHRISLNSEQCQTQELRDLARRCEAIKMYHYMKKFSSNFMNINKQEFTKKLATCIAIFYFKVL
ncbi:hypothetical protein SFRURICE_003924, partial [Spodoptera frugiperda]